MTSETPKRSHELPVTESRPASDVPVFGCVVYLKTTSEGTVDGRMANYEGLRATASTEREVLSKLVAEFKRIASAMHQRGEAVTLTDPPDPPAEGEVTRLVPVHL